MQRPPTSKHGTERESRDAAYLHHAIDLARKGAGQVAPNPLVGCVIVKNGRILGEGWHERYGGPHAERNALASCTEDPSGATAYVNLEPCCHQGKQPPCTDALIAAGIARVVAGTEDPNPLVAGHGFERLREAGIEVTHGVLAPECLRLNAAFFKRTRCGLPLVTLKYAMSLDGKTAVREATRTKISGEAALRHVHEQRSRAGAVMVGIGTALADDPLLTCRLGKPGSRNPVRVVADARLRLPINGRLVRSAVETPLVVATTRTADAPNPISHAKRKRALERAGATVIEAESRPSGKGCQHLCLGQVLRTLARDHGVDSLIVEGGGELAWSFATAGLVDRIEAYVSPALLGGTTAPTPLGGIGFPSPAAGLRLKGLRVERLGSDLLICGDVIGGALAGIDDAEGAPSCSRA